MDQNTHPRISTSLVGEVVALAEGVATACLVTTDAMAADHRGLVHGGFTFGLADYAAMLAVNDPNVVLGAAESRFLAPTTVGQTMIARAKVMEEKGKKRVVTVSVTADETEVMSATMTCFVLPKHVLDS
ncbi:MAG: acyl-coenzyme A thioesterase PaaI-like protein [Myxococcota bacterium]|jgi:acyl-coenzyme A thioesterase PaaI-like protein